MITKELQETLNFAAMEAIKRRHEYVTLEHLLYALLHDRTGAKVVRHCGGDSAALVKELESFFDEKMETAPASSDALPEYTAAFQRVVEYALLQAEGSGQKDVDGGNVLAALFQAEQSQAVYFLKKQGVTRLDVLNYLAHGISKLDTAGGDALSASVWARSVVVEGAAWMGGFGRGVSSLAAVGSMAWGGARVGCRG